MSKEIVVCNTCGKECHDDSPYFTGYGIKSLNLFNNYVKTIDTFR